jgi:hypothetical protein
MEVQSKMCSLTARMGLALVAAGPVPPFWTQQRKTYMLGRNLYNKSRSFLLKEKECWYNCKVLEMLES